MVKIRLRRKGRTHLPKYDVVLVDSRKKRDGAFIERIGYYDPHSQPSTISIDADRAIYWLNVGAQPTDIVGKLLSYSGIMLRRSLQFKGKPVEEINEVIEKHVQNATERYWKNKELRKKRMLAKEAAEKEKAEV
jgi:small subunit ribosomal protein S16